VVPEAMPRFEPLHIYQLQRHQGTQSQFRLCLGIIETSLEADAILDLVSEFYPRARCEPALDDDRAAVKRKVMAAQPPKRGAQSPRTRPPDPQPAAPFHWDIDELLPELAAHSADQTPPRSLNQPRPPTGAGPGPKAQPQPREAAESPEIAASTASTMRPRVDRAEDLRAVDDTVTDDSGAPRTNDPTTSESQHSEPPHRLASADVAAAPERDVEETESDPNAVTDQVETLQFTFGEPPVEEPPAETVNDEQVIEVGVAATHATFEDLALQPSRIEFEASVPANVEMPDGRQTVAEYDASEQSVPPTIAPITTPFEPADSHPADTQAPRPSTGDSGTLERFVARIGTLLESLKVAEPNPPQEELPAAASTQPTLSAPFSPPAPVDLELNTALDPGGVSPAGPAAAVPPGQSEVPETSPEPDADRAPQMRLRAAAVDPGRAGAHGDSASRSDAPEIDSTRTIRALTSLELSDEQASRWFVIQLTLCERPIDPAEVPNLAIFSEYRLYSVAGLADGRVMHALRLGFFSSESAAAAVGGYLSQFFDAPSVKRVSIAEQERFEERRLAAGKDAGDLGEHAVIELTCPATLPERQVSTASAPGNGESNPQESSSLWSRLLAPRKR
jgi:hypothetical protein